MLITFDLDDTLICWQQEIPTESARKPWYLWWFSAEPLRKGTADIFHKLKSAGWEALYSELRSGNLFAISNGLSVEPKEEQPR